jgi:4-amino-4-deoxy-L-arabinose transferase-like glycosyltransferase
MSLHPHHKQSLFNFKDLQFSHQQVFIFLLAFVIIWVMQLGLVGLTPPSDNLEQLVWHRSLEWGYYKHPPLPTWLAALAVQIGGINAWTSYFLGGIVTLFALYLWWLTMVQTHSKKWATIALLIGLSSSYLGGRTNYYNHNIVLFACMTLALYAHWNAITKPSHPSWKWWSLLGLALGLGAISKYQIVLVLFPIVGMWVYDKAWKNKSYTLGLFLAAIISMLVFLPHFIWLMQNQFPPMRYAVETSLGKDLDLLERFRYTLTWFGDQVFNRGIGGCIILLTIVLVQRKKNQIKNTPQINEVLLPEQQKIKIFWMMWGFIPFALMIGMGLFGGVRQQLHWGTAFLPLLVTAVMVLWQGQFFEKVKTKPIWIAFFIVQVLLLLQSQLTSVFGWGPLINNHWRNYPSEQVTQLIAPKARQEMQHPIRIISGVLGEAGATAILMPERPLVLLENNLSISPWINAAMISDCGYLELRNSSQKLNGFYAVGETAPELYWRVQKGLKPEAAHCLPD